MSQISLTFPDGNKREFAKGVTPAEVAAAIAPSLEDVFVYVGNCRRTVAVA